jgi:hypothetical protein
LFVREVDPNVAVRTDDASYWLPLISEKLQYVTLHPSYVIVIYFHQESIDQLAILKIPSLHVNLSIMHVDTLYFTANDVIFLKESSHLELIFFRPPSLLPIRQVDISQVEDRVLVRIDVDCHYSTDEHVSCVRLE